MDMPIAADIRSSPAPAAAPRRTSRQDWIIVGAAILVPSITSGLTISLNNFLLIPLQDQFHAARSTILFYLSFGSLSATLMMPIVGRMLVQRRSAVLMMSGLLVCVASMLAASMAPTLPLVLGGMVVATAAALSFCGPITSQVIVLQRMPERIGATTGAKMLVSVIAGATVPLAVAPLIAGYGWRLAMAVVAAGLAIIVGSLILGFLRKVAPPAAIAKAAAMLEPSAQDSAEKPLTTLQILRRPPFWLMILAIEPLLFLAAGMAANLIPFFHDRGFSLQQISYMMPLLGIAAALGAVAAGMLADRAPALSLGLASVLCALGAGSVSLGIGNPLFGFAVAYFAMGTITPSLASTNRRCFGPVNFAPVGGMIAPFMIFSSFAGALVAWLSETLGGYQTAFGMLALSLVFSLTAAMLLARAPRHPASY